MSEICKVCGLPKDLCVCDAIAKEQQQIIVRIEKKRFGKLMTIVEGLAGSGVDLNKLAKSLKARLACGGTVTDQKEILLQGDHRRSIRAALAKEGFTPESIKFE